MDRARVCSRSLQPDRSYNRHATERKLELRQGVDRDYGVALEPRS